MTFIQSTDTMATRMKDINRRLRNLESPGAASNSSGVNNAAVQGSGANSAATTTAGANNGGAPPAQTAIGSGTSGLIQFGSGTVPAAGAQCVVTFTPGLANVPKAIILTAGTSLSQSLGLWVSGISASGFTINSVNAPAASQAGSTYLVYYLVSLI